MVLAGLRLRLILPVNSPHSRVASSSVSSLHDDDDDDDDSNSDDDEAGCGCREWG